jgi:hypothetical protein
MMFEKEGWSEVITQMGRQSTKIPAETISRRLIYDGIRDTRWAAELDVTGFGDENAGYGISEAFFFGPKRLTIFTDTGDQSNHENASLRDRMQMKLRSWDGDPTGELTVEPTTLGDVAQDLRECGG